MTVASPTNRKEYTGNGVTTAFATSPFVFFAETDLEVYVVVTATGAATLKTLTTHYTVSGGAGSTGTVTMLTAPASTETLVIVRTMPLTQATDFVNNDLSDAEVQEDALDKLTMLAQQNSARIDRSIVIPDSDVAGTATELPVASVRANKFLYFDAVGTPTASAQVAAGTLYFAPTTQLLSGTGAQTVFTLNTAPGSADAIIVAISGVVQKPGTDFTVSGVTLTFTAAPANGTNNVAVQNFGVAGSVDPGAATLRAELLASSGSSLVGTIRTETGAAARTLQSKGRDVIDIRDFKNDNGTAYLGDGVQDDTTAVERAKAAANGKTLYISGTPLITSTLSFTENIRLIFEGCSGILDDPLGAHFIKAAAMTDMCVLVASQNFAAEGGGVVGQAGNTGDGIQFLSNGATWIRPSVFRCGRDGIRVGGDVAGNSTSVRIEHGRSSWNGRHGFHRYAVTNDNNNLTFDHCIAQSNTGDGFKLDGAGGNTLLLQPFSMSNTGYGLNVNMGSRDVVILGDFEQNNGGGAGVDILLSTNAHGTLLLNPGTVAIVNNSATATIINTDDSSGGWNEVRSVVAHGGSARPTFTLRNRTPGTVFSGELRWLDGDGNLGWSVGNNKIIGSGNLEFNEGTNNRGYFAPGGALQLKSTLRVQDSMGYGPAAIGVGGTVTQGAGSGKATGVTLSLICGRITMDAANLLADTTVSFVLTNTGIAATDLLILNHVSGGTAGSYTLNAQCAAGSATINVRNITAGALAEAIVIGFILVKGVIT